MRKKEQSSSTETDRERKQMKKSGNSMKRTNASNYIAFKLYPDESPNSIKNVNSTYIRYFIHLQGAFLVKFESNRWFIFYGRFI